MAPDVNWDVIESIATGSETNEDALEKASDMLHEVNADEYSDEPQKLVTLFQAAQKAFAYKEKAITEVFQDEILEKDAEIKELERDLEEEKKYGSANVPHDVDFYRTENRRLTEEKEDLEIQYETLKTELNDVMDERNKMEEDSKKLHQEVKYLKDHNHDLQQTLREYQAVINKKPEGSSQQAKTETRDKLKEKNQNIADLMNEITRLEEVNRGITDGNQKLKKEMEGGQEEMEKMAEEYEKMKKVIGASDQFTDDLQRQNAQMKMQLADLREQLQAKLSEEDAITEAVNNKVDEWKLKLEQRDKENSEQARTIERLRRNIAAASLDQDRIKAERLEKKLKEGDAEIKKLQAGLSQAVSDLEEQTAIVEDLRKDSGLNRETLAYKSQIRNLQAQVQKQEAIAREAESLRANAEADAQESDLKLTEALKRVGLLESGQYGLTEAVNEIKDCKNSIRQRDQEIREMTKVTNQLEEKINDLLEENEEYRERLGIDPRNMDDITELRKKRVLRQQQFRAENQVLLKEIEDLEEERISLKKQIRRQAQSQSQKAAEEGLHPDDMDLIDEFVEELIKRRKEGLVDAQPLMRSYLKTQRSDKSIKSPRRDDSRIDVEGLERRAEDARVENRKLMQENDSLTSENNMLRDTMKKILDELKKTQDSPSRRDIHIPSLDRLIQILEAKHFGNSVGSGLLKSEVDQLTGRNEELRSELRILRTEHTSLSSDNKSLRKEIAELKGELNLISKVTENGRRVNVMSLGLPKDSSDSDDVITALNEHLLQLLDDSQKKDEKNTELKDALENSRRQLQLLRHQTHLIYKEHHSEKEKWNQNEKDREEEKSKLQEKLDKDAVRLEEYERLLSTLQSDPDDMKKKLSETSRKVSLLRVNEKTLIRRYKALEASEELLTNENHRLKREISNAEGAVSERISYLERYKAMASFKIESLQKSLEGSISESELTTLSRRFDELTAKYRDILQKENQFVANNVKLDAMQEEVKLALEKADALRGELSIEKEKRHTLEEALKRSNNPLVKSGDKDYMNEMQSVMQKFY